MPLYTDGNFYYSGGSSQLYSPYYPSGLYTSTTALPGSGVSYSPYTPTYNRTISGSYIVPLTPPRSPSTYTSSHSLSPRYQPKLTTITESSPLLGSARHGLTSLTRIQSPKYSSYSNTTTGTSSLLPKYIPPRPIHINTADIDVSSARYRKHKETTTEEETKKKAETEIEPRRRPSQSPSPAGSIKKRGSKEEEKSRNEIETMTDERRAERSTIRRNRPVVRLSTIRPRNKEQTNATNEEPTEPAVHIFRDLPHPPITTATTAENLTWREKLAEDLAAIPDYPIKKSPGDLIRERYFIQNKKKPDEIATETNKVVEKTNALIPQLIDKVVVDFDPLHHTIRRLSLPKCPTFHDICEDISSDKIDDDLNAGELRRRASLIQEQEQEILNQLQKSASGTFQLIHLERRDSQNSTPDEKCLLGSKRKSRKSKKIRHKITAIVDIENTTVLQAMPILMEKEEEAPTPAQREHKPSPKFTYSVDSVEEHDEFNKVFKLAKKKSTKKSNKSKEVTLPEGFLTAPPKIKRNAASKTTGKKPKTYECKADIFTFSQKSIEASRAEELPTNELDIIKEQELIKDKAKPERQLIETNPAVKSLKSKVDKILEPKPKNAVLSNIKETEKKNKTPSPTAAKKLLKTKELIELQPQTLKASVSLDLDLKKPMQAIATTLKKSQSLQTEAIVSSPEIEQALDKTDALKTIAYTLESSIIAKAPSLNKIETQPGVATPKPIRKAIPKSIEKSESGEDFWSQIGTRETIYMDNRKKSLHEIQWQHVEEIEPQTPKVELKEMEQNRPLEHAKETTWDLQKTAGDVFAKKSMKKPCDEVVVQKSETEVKDTVVPQQKTPPTSTKPLKKSTPKKKFSPLAKAKVLKDDPNLATAVTTQLESVEKLTPTVAKMTDTTAAINAMAFTTNGTTTATPKINVGQEAKSPEQQTKSKISTNEISTSVKQDRTPINNAETSTKTNDKTNDTAPTTTATTTAYDTKSITDPTVKKQHLQPEVSSKNINKVTEDENTVKKRTSDPKSPIATSKTAIENDEKTKLPFVKPKVATAKVSPPANVRTTASTPINADHFITKAPPPATAIATTTTNKNAAPTTATSLTKATANKKSPKTSPAKVGEKANISKTKEDEKEATSSKATTTTAAAPPATTTMSIATAAANINDEHDTTACATKASECSGSLSKFATVSNLAQCLQDVDADIEDYIVPSSAEEYDDDDNLSDISLPDGFEHLSEEMKKKLKQKKKKERQEAEKARFDPQKKVKIDLTNKCYVKDEAPRFPLVATPRPLWRREKIEYPDEDTESESDSDSGSTEETTEDSEECTTSEEYEDDLATASSGSGAVGGVKENTSIIRMSTCSNDSGFEGGTAPSSPKKMLECDVNCHKKCERLTANLCGVNQKLIVEALAHVKRGARETRESPSTPPSLNPAYKIDANVEEEDETSRTYTEFQKTGRFTAPATVIPKFKNYCLDDFHFLAVLGKGSFGKVLLAELRDTTYYYAVKCLKKDVVLEDDDVDSTLIERKVLALGTRHPYLCHLFCTFQTESHLFFVMEYLNGGDLMFHIQESGRFTEERARFYGAEIISGLKFLHKKGIIYRDLKLDNVLLDYEGHVRIADFGMCKLQIYLDKTADSFCGTPDYMAPEIVKGEKYNQNVDWWSFGVLLYEMLIGQSPFSGCDEDELFWSICNEIPWFPVYITAEAKSILKGLLEKDSTKRIGSQYSPAGDVSEHVFFKSIDWNLLEKRQLEPPFRPQVKHPLDTQYFDRVFTKERVRLTPIDKDILQSMDQKQFLGFTYTNPHITLD